MTDSQKVDPLYSDPCFPEVTGHDMAPQNVLKQYEKCQNKHGVCGIPRSEGKWKNLWRTPVY